MTDRAGDSLMAHAEAILRALASAKIGVIVAKPVDADLQSLAANDAAVEILGRPREVILSRPAFEFIAPEERARIQERLSRRMSGAPMPPVHEAFLLHGSGRRVPVMYAIEQHPDGVMVGLFMDVSDRYEAERALRSEEQRLRALVEAAPDGIVISRDGAILEANPAAARMLGYERAEELVGVSLHGLMSPSDTKTMIERVAAVATGARLAPRLYEARMKDGKRVVAEITSVPFEHGGKPAIMGFARDVTDRMELERQLARNDRLAALGTLAAGVAHEINNPLTVASLAIDSLEMQLRASSGQLDPSSLPAILGDLRGAVDRIASIVRELRVFSRDDVAEARGPVDVHDPLRAAVRLVGHELRHRGHTVRERLDSVPFVVGDTGRLEQVFVNLLLNASQALPEGRAENRIDVRTFLGDDGRVVVEVSDNGCGMPPEVTGRVFEPFFTTKPVGSGTGLGLSISYGIVKRFGGDIAVDSTVGQGTTIRVFLLPATSKKVEAKPSGAVADAMTRRLRVLFVDDEPRLLAAMRALLSPEHDVTAVDCGEAALAKILEDDGDYDVILCDVMMSGVSGIDVYERVAEKAPELLPRFVMMTGGACTPRAERFLESVPNRVLHKPFDVAAASHAIREVASASDRRR